MSKNIINVDSLNKYHQGLKVTYLDPLEKKIDGFESGDKFLNEVTRLDEKIDENVGTINSQLEQKANINNLPFIDILSYGIKGDGTDSVKQIQDALSLAVSKNKYIKFPSKGYFYIDDTLTIPKGANIDFNYSIIETLSDIDVPAIHINDNDVNISNLYLKEQNAFGSDSVGVLVEGEGLSFIKLKNINTDGFLEGIKITSKNETISNNIIVSNCSTINSSAYGLIVSYCDGCYIENHYSCDNIYDGLKAGTHCSNVHVNGGQFNYNGKPTSQGGSGYGDGIDLYAGGSNFKIIGATCKGNLGAGIHCMNGEYNIPGDELYRNDLVGNIIISNCIVKNNGGNGIDLIVFHKTPEAPQSANNIIDGNIIINNGCGIQLNAKDSIVSNNIIKRTGENGIHILNGKRLTLSNNTILSPQKNGILSENGKDIKIIEGIIDGVENIGDNTFSMINPIYIDNKSNENSTYISNVNIMNYNSNCPVLVSNKTNYPNAINIINLNKVQEMSTKDYYGFSAGSSVLIDNVMYYKTSSNINSNAFYKFPKSKASTKTLVGDGSTRNFNIEHGMGVTPNIFNATPRATNTANIPYSLQCDDTNIKISFLNPLPEGTHTLNWYVQVF